MSPLLVAYLVGFGVTVVVGLVVWTLAFSNSDARNGARIILLSPAWPLVLLWGIWAGLRNLWREAEFGGKR